MKIVTRFAPSPTGALHAGVVRTALFAWLLAKKHNGTFILRIEDTDQKREVEGSADNIVSTLKWLGLVWDQGPEVGGPQAPYYQSQRLDIYKEWAQKLIDNNLAYADPYTPQEVQAFREQAQKNKKPFLYRNHRPTSPPEWDGSQPLRLRSDPKTHQWHDEVMGDLSMGPEMIDDIVLIKSDGFPTYNFCHIIDDHLMGVTHIVRSQEFISSTPKYLNLYEALDIPAPKFITPPPVMNEGGNKKLSKRDGAKEMLWYKQQGYLPSALLNFMATLGWNDGTEQEVFTTDELIQKFSQDRIQKSGAQFDERRLLWMSGQHIRSMPIEDLYQKVANYWPSEASDASKDYKMQVLALTQERLKFFAELPELTRFFFTDLPLNSTLISGHKKLKKLPSDELKRLLSTALDSINASTFTTEDLQTILNNLLEKTNQKPAVLFSLIRIATTQSPASPGLAETMSVLGKDTTTRRLEQQIAAL